MSERPWTGESTAVELRRNARELRQQSWRWTRGVPRQPGDRCALIVRSYDDGLPHRCLSETAQEACEEWLHRTSSKRRVTYPPHLASWNDRQDSAEDVATLFEAVADMLEPRP